MDNLKQKVIIGAKWSLLEKIINIGFEFIVGILLARLLMPADFGTVAIITVIISFSAIFVNSGFSQSLVRDPEADDRDFSTIFFFNIVIGLLFYCAIFFLSSSVARFYGNIELALYVKVIGLSIFISSLTLVQRVKMTREMNFELMSKISIGSNLVSGVLALFMAFYGLGIWSLISKTLSREVIQTGLFWISNNWKTSYVFEPTILKKHFKYGSSFLLSAIIGQVYNNILALAVGKIYNLQTLGYYNRAQLFSNTISENIGGVLTGVSFPALSKVQNDKEKFVRGVSLLLRQAFFVIGILMTLVFFSAKVFIPFLLGDQWAKAGEFLQYLSIIGFFGVLNSILLNSISVTGRSKIYLYFQILALVFNLITLIIGHLYGINAMLLILILFYFISYLLVSYVFNHFFRYSLLNQFKDYFDSIKAIIPIILIGIFFSYFDASLYLTCFMVFLQLTLVITFSTWFKTKEFELLLKMIFKK